MYRILVLLLLAVPATAQPLRLYPGGDSSRSITLEGYADVYLGFDRSQPADGNRPYFVSHARHNETNVNLAYLSLQYASDRVRARFTPAFGTYMNANYAAERQTLQNLLEATIGLRPFRNRRIWLDAGVFTAPYTTETAVAHDQLLYTRSFGADYSPYYLAGIRATVPLTGTVTASLFLVNGWQVIQNTNAPLSFGTALEWKPSATFTLNASTYFGNESSVSQPQYRGRVFADVSAVWMPTGKLTLSADIYAGRQRLADSVTRKTPVSWYQGQLNAGYALTAHQRLGARIEYFRDAHAVLAVPVTGGTRFDCASATLGYHLAVTGGVIVHAEARVFWSETPLFNDSQRGPVRSTGLLIGGLTARF